MAHWLSHQPVHWPPSAPTYTPTASTTTGIARTRNSPTTISLVHRFEIVEPFYNAAAQPHPSNFQATEIKKIFLQGILFAVYLKMVAGKPLACERIPENPRGKRSSPDTHSNCRSGKLIAKIERAQYTTIDVDPRKTL
jgi:hypothetical protein